jgi:hypothetical protein
MGRDIPGPQAVQTGVPLGVHGGIPNGPGCVHLQDPCIARAPVKTVFPHDVQPAPSAARARPPRVKRDLRLFRVSRPAARRALDKSGNATYRDRLTRSDHHHGTIRPDPVRAARRRLRCKNLFCPITPARSLPKRCVLSFPQMWSRLSSAVDPSDEALPCNDPSRARQEADKGEPRSEIEGPFPKRRLRGRAP